MRVRVRISTRPMSIMLRYRPEFMCMFKSRSFGHTRIVMTQSSRMPSRRRKRLLKIANRKRKRTTTVRSLSASHLRHLRKKLLLQIEQQRLAISGDRHLRLLLDCGTVSGAQLFAIQRHRAACDLQPAVAVRTEVERDAAVAERRGVEVDVLMNRQRSIAAVVRRHKAQAILAFAGGKCLLFV